MARHAQRSIDDQDIGFSDFTILEALLHKGPMLVNEIGRRVSLTSGSITTGSTGSRRAGSSGGVPTLATGAPSRCH